MICSAPAQRSGKKASGRARPRYRFSQDASYISVSDLFVLGVAHRSAFSGINPPRRVRISIRRDRHRRRRGPPSRRSTNATVVGSLISPVTGNLWHRPQYFSGALDPLCYVLMSEEVDVPLLPQSRPLRHRTSASGFIPGAPCHDVDSDSHHGAGSLPRMVLRSDRQVGVPMPFTGIAWSRAVAVSSKFLHCALIKRCFCEMLRCEAWCAFTTTCGARCRRATYAVE